MNLVISFAVIAIIAAIWTISKQRKLMTVNKNINNIMSRIGAHLSSGFDAVNTLLNLAKGHSVHESQSLIETVKSRRGVITAASTPDDVLVQERMLSEVLGRISMLAEKYPSLKTDENYSKHLQTAHNCKKEVYSSRLIYNDNIAKLNREICAFPTSLLAGFFGFRKREYLESAEEKFDINGIR